MQHSPTRRSVLRTATVGGALALGGCLGSADPAGNATRARAGEPAGTGESTAPSTAEDVDTWLATANVPRAEGDRRLQDAVRILVGDHRVTYAFRPARVRVSPGTTVEWHWVEGLANNVVSLDGTFHSGEPTDDPEVTFGHTFEAPGTHRYVSEPHRECGMRGVVSVEEAPTSDYPEVDRWLLPADNYDGTVTDETGAATTTVVVGAEGADGHHFAFEPPALKVSPGATVRWVWTGEGGAHDVAFRDGDVQSADITAEAGATHEHTFESTGIYRYACRPHEGIGQRGAIVVE